MRKVCITLIICLWLGALSWVVYEQNYSIETLAGLAPTISAESAILIDAKDGSVIYEKNADKRMYPASTTKIMTALCALEIMEEVEADMSSQITVTAESVGVEGSSVYLKRGEKVSLEELLYGMMLQSGNDAATATAVSLGPGLGNFVLTMNKRAETLGCEDTHFSNPTGLFDKNHYTTARDLAVISREAMQNPVFRDIVCTEQWLGKESGRNFSNKNKTIHQYEGATGIKIGYTKASGRTLVASAKRGETELIAVVLSAPDWFEDAYALLDYGFLREEGK